MPNRVWLVVFACSAALAVEPRQYDVALPPLFQANRGQMPLDVRYFAAGGGYTLALAPGEMRLSPADGRGDVVIAFAGSPDTRIEAENPLPFHIHSIKGSDPRGWLMNSLAWSRVRYRQIQPGVDLVFHPAPGGRSAHNWEYDFELAPGADPSGIQFEVRGAASLEVDLHGDLYARTARGASLRWRKPESYQKSGAATRSIATAFVVSGMRVGFSIAAWDRSQPLTIDPAFVFSTYFGGTGNEIARGIARDSSGAIYICGSTSSGNLPTSRASYQPNYRGGSAYTIGDAFLAKFTASGALSFVTYLGGSGDDIATALALDSAGNVYLTGFTSSLDFPFLGGFQKNYGGSGGNHFAEGGDAFVARFTPAGALSYSTYLGGTQDDAGLAIAVDAAGNAYVAGSTLSPNFPASGGYQTTFGGTDPSFVNANGYVGLHQGDAFVAKISSSGQQLLAATYLGGRLDDVADAITLDSSGNVWVGGATNSTNFPVVNPFQANFGGGSPGAIQPVARLGDGFVSKLNSGLTNLLYSTYLGGSGDDGVTALVVDSGGSAYIAGLTLSANFPTTTGVAYKGPTALANGRTAVTGDAFLLKLNPNGKTLTYSTLLGGSDNEYASALAVDAAGNAYMVGMTGSNNFPLAGGPQQSGFGGAAGPDGVGDAFLAKFDSSAKLVYSSYLGGNGQDIALGLALDSSGTAYITGITSSSNFPVSAPYQPSYSSINRGGYNSFLTVVSGLGGAAVGASMTANPGATPQTAAPGSAFANALAVTVTDASGNAVPGVSVTFTAPASGAGGTFEGGGIAVTTATNASGIASATKFTANAVTGSYTVTATSAGLPMVNFALTNSLTAPLPVVTSVANAASLARGAVAPGEVVAIGGAGLGPAVTAAGVADPSTGILGSMLGGSSVTFDGIAAPIISASATQLIAIVPYELDGADATRMVVSFSGQSSAALGLAVAQTAPGLYAADSSGAGQALAANPDSTPNSGDNPANAGDAITLLGTGEGQTDPPGVDGLAAMDVQPQPVQPLSVTIGGQPATVTSFGAAPGQAGRLQIIVRIPDGLDAGSQPVVLTVGAAGSQPNLTVAVRGN